MTQQEAITTCRMAHATEGARWPAPLIAYLDDPANGGRGFDWLCSCVAELLEFYGRATPEITEALSSARRQAREGNDFEAIERTAWSFWSRRSMEEPVFTAVAQLLFALSRAGRSDRELFAHASATPILLLEQLESRSGVVLDRVTSHFSIYVAQRETEM
jgi:hypothetical protein